MKSSGPLRGSCRYIASFCLVMGTFACALGAIACVLSRNLFDSGTFGRRAADSLSDPGVASYTAEVITRRIVHRKPDLVAFRPVLLSVIESVVSNTVFRSVVDRAAQRAHGAVFSEGSQRVLLSLPDLNILVQEALRNASPGLAAKIPKTLDSTVAGIVQGTTATVLLKLTRLGKPIKWAWPMIFALAVVLYSVTVWLAEDRQRAMVRAGFSLVVAGLVLPGIVAANPVAAIWIHDLKELGLVRGLWRTYLGDLDRWGFLFIGLGVLIASGASSLLERIDPIAKLLSSLRLLASPPATYAGRLIWGFALFLGGSLICGFPGLMLTCVAVLTGICIAYLGLRELFRIFVETLETGENSAALVQPATRRRGAAIPVALLVVPLCSAWFLWRNPAASPVRAASAVLACNGFPELCERRIDQVVFAGAHNAMSSQNVPGWMFPHHEAGIPQMLRDGVRALLVDVHYGFPGGSRIKTDMRMEPNADTIKRAIGSDGYAAAMRIRDRLVGVDEKQHGLYFCHGFCELGAYPVLPAFRDIRDFLVANPDEVIIMIVEDTVTPEDLATELQKAGLTNLIYMDNPVPQWPTLHELIERDKRVLVFIESGRPGIPWLRPAFENLHETPYTFHNISDFSCRPNRGGDTGRLFQINHWIDTTPAPRPSNAAVVNAYAFLLDRARQCASERQHLPNVIAVDFYQTGDIFEVVNTLNGVGESEEKAAEAVSSSADQQSHQ